MIDTCKKTKYERWYDEIIARAQSRILEGYSEEHHIKPKSIYGEGPTVTLTAREHFLVHWLLTKMTSGDDLRKMQYAFNCMAMTRGRKLTAAQYQAAKTAVSSALRSDVKRGEKISMAKIGRTFSDGHKEALAAAHRGKVQSDESKAKRSESLRKAHAEGRHAGMKGKSQTEKQKQAASTRFKGVALSEEHRAKIAAANSGKPGTRTGVKLSKETKAKMAEARRLYWERKKAAEAAS